MESTSNGNDELQKLIADESTLYSMQRYIHTHFASQALAIEIYFRIQSKVQKEEEKAKERSGQPEVSMPEFMLYMNAVGSFLKPGLVEQKTETPKTDSPEKGWQKVVYKKKNRLRQFKPKVTPSFSEFVKSYNPFDKLKGEGKTTVGMSSELGKEKVSKPCKPISKPVKPRRVREVCVSSVDCLGMLKNTAGRTRKRISLISLVIYVKEGTVLHPAILILKCITSIMRDSLQGNSI